MIAEAKIRMKKDKITLEVEGDKKSTNPKMFAKRKFVSNIGQIGGKEDRERREVKKKSYDTIYEQPLKQVSFPKSNTKEQIHHAVSARKLWRQEFGPNGDPEGRLGPRRSVGWTFLGA